ncbi:hypothetical protein CesoFtcFv8_023809 [Champsocephalus esox]|uniref:Uncharacterized protein n=1 Tax=Champsocephalus esox TaxID=159716 RepID=A0AAN8B4J9_9TELE|nr:hypothetical protein CesoFtcFv8_023809 [Champsocephalus esox]
MTLSGSSCGTVYLLHTFAHGRVPPCDSYVLKREQEVTTIFHNSFANRRLMWQKLRGCCRDDVFITAGGVASFPLSVIGSREVPAETQSLCFQTEI